MAPPEEQAPPARDQERAPQLRWPVQKWTDIFAGALIAASTDDSRPQLASIRVERVDNAVTVASTDGHWLLRWREVEGETDENGDKIDRTPFAVTIPRRTIEAFLGSLKSPLLLEHVVLRCDETPYSLETILDVRRHEFLPTAEPFPPLEDVIPKFVDPKGSAVSMGAGLLTKVAKAFARAVGSKDAAVHMQMAGDALSPLVCTSPIRHELLAVVMPMRTGDENAVPEKPVADSGMAAPEKGELDDRTESMFPDADGVEAASKLVPSPGGGIDSVTISVEGHKPVTFSSEDGTRLRKLAKEMRKKASTPRRPRIEP